MATKGLLFIPDISGFSRFVNGTEIEHSRLIIQELLEIIIDSNNLGLEISEIEGDAVLFYKFGEPPLPDELYKQVEKMFLEFHGSIIAYDHLRYCQCKACSSVLELTLKVITHYGEFTGYRVRDFHKLIGKDLIVAHQLLKNDIPEHEYWLVTDTALSGEKFNSLYKGLHWNTSSKQTEGGQVPFHYAQLGSLKKSIQNAGDPALNLEKKTKLFTLSKTYDTSVITLLHAAADFQYRHRWREGVKQVDELNHFLPRVGMRCHCLMENGESYVYASSYRYTDDHIEFSETDDSTNTTYMTIDKLDTKVARLTLSFYAHGNDELHDQAVDKWNSETMLKKSLDNLSRFVPEMEAILASCT